MEDYHNIEKPTGEDVFLTAVREMMKILPGGNFFDAYWVTFLGSPIEKRRANWFQELHERVKVLEERNGLDILALQENDLFVDAVLRITPLANATSYKEKRDAFKNALTNIALDRSPSEVKKHLFIGLIDTFSVEHLRMLQFFDNMYLWYTDRGLSMPYGGGMVLALLNQGKLDFGDDHVRSLVISQLQSQGMLKPELTIRKHLNNHEAGSRYSTSLGQEFLSFISFDDR